MYGERGSAWEVAILNGTVLDRDRLYRDFSMFFCAPQATDALAICILFHKKLDRIISEAFPVLFWLLVSSAVAGAILCEE